MKFVIRRGHLFHPLDLLANMVFLFSMPYCPSHLMSSSGTCDNHIANIILGISIVFCLSSIFDVELLLKLLVNVIGVVTLN